MNWSQMHHAYLIGVAPVDLIPASDLSDDAVLEHVAGGACPCGPTVEASRLGGGETCTVYIHHGEGAGE